MAQETGRSERGTQFGSDVNKRGIALISSAHLVDDLYQGAVPALLPFLALHRHYSYAAVAGITLAATVLSSVAQPAFGIWADRHPRRWLVAAGLSTAAVGIALAGLTSTYALTWIVVAISGLGIAAFHPEAARVARQAAGDSNKGMAVFALGGNAGYALGSLVTTGVLIAFGLHGTVLLIAPAAAMAVLLIVRLGPVLAGPAGSARAPVMPSGRDDWRSFLRLTAVVVIRSVIFFGVTSFLALYFINHLHTSTDLGGAALTIFLVSGAVGTLLGGWIGDRFGRLTSIRIGFALLVPILAGLVLADNVAVALVFVVLAGIGAYLPFSVMVMLGQDYLPNRIGTASGVTVGLAVSIGGLASPLLGWLADGTSLRTAFAVLIALPVLGLAVAALLHDPAHRGPSSGARAAVPVSQADPPPNPS